MIIGLKRMKASLPSLAISQRLGSGMLRFRVWLTEGVSLSLAGTITGTGTWQDVEMTVNASAGQPATVTISALAAVAVLVVFTWPHEFGPSDVDFRHALYPSTRLIVPCR